MYLKPSRQVQKQHIQRERQPMDFNISNGILETYCGDAKNVVIPEGIVKIGNFAFMENRNLVSVTIPGSVTVIGRAAFCNCPSLTTVTIADGLLSIEDSAFLKCGNLSNLKLPATLGRIGDSAFMGCSSLSHAAIPSGCGVIRQSTFANCVNLQSVDIPTSITEICDSAFYNCQSLASVRIPACVEAIGEGAFENCGNLRNIVLPQSVSVVGKNAFRGCPGYTTYKNEPTKTTLNETIAPNANKKSGCYIATAVYGSYDCSQVWVLRRFRDEILSQSHCGRAFIRAYYAISPMIVRRFGDSGHFKGLVTPILDSMVTRLRARGVSDTQYEDKCW